MIALILIAAVLWIALIFALIEADRQKMDFWSAAQRCDYYRSEVFKLRGEVARLKLEAKRAPDNVVPFPQLDRGA